jgi:methylenetetrahydrofolate reductase (NADPH)
MSCDILDGFSLEMTGKDVPSLNEARTLLPAVTRVNVTYLGHDDFEMRRTAIRAVAAWGLTPVPHISSRRLASQQALEEFSLRFARMAPSMTSSLSAATRPGPKGRTAQQLT